MQGHSQQEGRRDAQREETWRVEREIMVMPFRTRARIRRVRSPPRKSPSGASSTGRNARQPGHTRLLQLRGNEREKNSQFTSQSVRQTLRPTYTTLHARYAYTCPLPPPIKSKSHSLECRVASNPTSRGVFVRAKHEPRSLVASIIQVYSVILE